MAAFRETLVVPPHPSLFENVKPFPPHESLVERWTRRPVNYALYTLAWILVLGLLPVWLLIGAIVDLIKATNWTCVRMTLFLLTYITFELLAALLLFGQWLLSGYWLGLNYRRYLLGNFWVQRWWVANMMAICMRLFGARLEVEGLPADIKERPFILFKRHASMLDTIMTPYIFYPLGIHLRIVAKRELRWDIALDTSLGRLPNAFVRRGSGDAAHEIENVAHLMDGLGPGEAVMIYPEGTRFTPAKKARILEKIKQSGDAAAYARAEAFQRVLPPRPGGPLALLERNTGADVLFCAHTGLEKTHGFRTIFNGGAVGAVVRFHYWRVRFEDIPASPNARAEWLYNEWKKVDDFACRYELAKPD